MAIVKSVFYCAFYCVWIGFAQDRAVLNSLMIYFILLEMVQLNASSKQKATT